MIHGFYAVTKAPYQGSEIVAVALNGAPQYYGVKTFATMFHQGYKSRHNKFPFSFNKMPLLYFLKFTSYASTNGG